MDGLNTVLEHKLGIKTRFVVRTCEKHGKYRSLVGYNITGQPLYSECTECRRERDIAKDEQARIESGRIALDQANVDKEALVKARLLRAGIPQEYTGCSFSNFRIYGTEQQMQDLYDVVNTFRWICNSTIMNLSVMGQTGRGKTHLAAATLRYVLEKDPEQKLSVRYIRESRLLRACKASFSSKTYTGPSEQEIIDDLSAVDVLVIDEIGKAKTSEYNAQALEEIMDARYQKRRTIILGNLVESDFKSHFSDGTLSRLSWKSGKKAFPDGEDYRRRLELEG